ncbi:MAG TPA: DinB family protein [Aeromicrobium sp.]|nr:DinB family protein [Aeromicrobium sp.]
MTTKDAIRYALGLAEGAFLPAIDAMAGAPLTYPTSNGGCHPLWVMGHLAVVEGMLTAMLTHGTNPAQHWEPLFAQDSVAVSDASRYPTFDEVRATFLALRHDNLKRLDAMSEVDLDRPTPWQPRGLEEHFSTVGRALLTVALHQTMHRGQVTDAMRASGRRVIRPAADVSTREEVGV